MAPVTVSSLRKPHNHEIPSLGIVTVRPITLGMHQEAENEAARVSEGERALTFTRHVIFCLVEQPILSLDDVARLPQEAFDALVKIAADTSGVGDEYSETSSELLAHERLYSAFQLHGETQMKRMWGSVSSLYDHLSEVAATASRLYNNIGTDALEQARALNRLVNIEDVLKSFKTLNAVPDLQDRIAAFSNISQSVLAQIAMQGTDELEAIQRTTRIQLPDVAKQFAALKLPEPILSDSLIATGLNAPFLHSPTYAFPEIERIEDEDDFREREKVTRRRRLVDAYDILSELEQALRDLIEGRLRELHGDQWWKRGVPDVIRQHCDERKAAKEKPGESEYHPLTYAYFDDYRAILTRRDNWDKTFKATFLDSAELEVCIRWVSRVRDPIAHSRPIEDDNYSTFVTAANVLQRKIRRGVK